MKRLIVLGLFLNALLLAGRFCQELDTASARVEASAEGRTATQNGDIDGDGNRTLADAIGLLLFLFQRGPEPVAIAQLEGGLTAEQAEILSHMTIVQLPVDDLDDAGEGGRTAKTIRFTGVNVQVVNGLGVTNGNDSSINGGSDNRASGDSATVNGGFHNTAAGHGSSILGGGGREEDDGNQALGPFSTITGGRSIVAEEEAGSRP